MTNSGSRTIEDMDKNETRRSFLAAAGAVPLALFFARTASAQNVCVDPASLPLAQKNRRRGLGYVEPTPDAKKRCGACAFFTVSQPGCGTCQMLSGGPVSDMGVCTSFTPKS